MIDTARLRREFPILQKSDAPAYLDNACMALKPRSVIEAVTRYYEETPYCAGRAVYEGSLRVEQIVEEARRELASLLGAAPRGTVFTKNATEAINLVAHAYPWTRGDVVLTTDREHNSNLVPWHQLAAKGVRHEVVASRSDGALDLDAWRERLARGDVRLVAAVHVSNLDGYVAPARDLVALAHEHGARVLLDGAQAAPHVPVDLARLDADYYAVSVHKMMGPTGVGALLAKSDALDVLSPFMTGGDTVARSTYEASEFLDAPAKFEAGLQNYAGLAGVAPAARLLRSLGMANVEQHGRALMRRAARGLDGVDGVTLVGAPLESRTGIVPLALTTTDPHTLAILLEDKHGVLVRSGDHCLHAWFNAKGVPGALRMSTHAYTNEQDVDRFVDGVKSLLATLAAAS